MWRTPEHALQNGVLRVTRFGRSRTSHFGPPRGGGGPASRTAKNPEAAIQKLGLLEMPKVDFKYWDSCEPLPRFQIFISTRTAFRPTRCPRTAHHSPRAAHHSPRTAHPSHARSPPQPRVARPCTRPAPVSPHRCRTNPHHRFQILTTGSRE